MKQFLFGILMLFITSATLASSQSNAGVVASNATDLLQVIIEIISTILYIAAMGVFISAVMKYRIHRQNPQQIPLSTPLTELVLAIILAAIPTITRISNEELFSNNAPPPPQPAAVAPAPYAPPQPYQAPTYPAQPYHPPYQPPTYSQ